MKELINDFNNCEIEIDVNIEELINTGLAPPAVHGGPLLRLHHAPTLLLRLAQRVVGGRRQRGRWRGRQRGRGEQRLQVRVRGAAGLLDSAALRRVQLIQASSACILFYLIFTYRCSKSFFGLLCCLLFFIT